MPSPDRHFANAAIFTHSTGLTPNSGDAALYIKTDNKAYIKDSAGNEAPVASIGGSTGSTDNLVLRADGTGGATVQNSAIQIDDATTSTQNNVAITNQHAGQTDSALVLTPKGTGAFILGPKPDGTATGGGNARGTGSVDLNTERSAATQVASGNYSVTAGQRNIASGANSVSIGQSNTASGANSTAIGSSSAASATQSLALGPQATASGTNSVAIGIQTTASAGQSIAIGQRSTADRHGMLAHAAGYFSAVPAGGAQNARFVMRIKTTNNTATEMFLDGSSARLTVASGKILALTINLAGSKNDGTAVAHYLRQYCIKNVSGTTSEVYAPVPIGTDNAAGTSIALSANDTNDALKVDVTGITGETWAWVAVIDAVEIAYAS